MKYYEGYIHSTGTLMVKTVPPGFEKIVDQSSLHVYKYLGKIQMSSLNMARQKFIQMNGGKQYEDMSQIKKDIR